MKSAFLRNVYIIDGARTPFLKNQESPGNFSASDLALLTGNALLARQAFSPQEIDEVIIGCMIPASNEANIGRIIALRLGCGKKVPGWTVQRNCGSGLQAIDSAAQLIGTSRAELVLAGGTEAMSRAPLLFDIKCVNWLAQWHQAKIWQQKLKVMTQFRPKFLRPIIALLQGLTDPVVGVNMGQTAEIIAHRFRVSREQMDCFALESHRRLAQAFDQQWMTEITPIYDIQGKYYDIDQGLRRDTTLEKLAALKPVFDKPYGSITAGNSSQISDGAALVILASEEAVKKYQLPIAGKIIDTVWAGVDPEQMGLGPVHAIAKLLKKQNLILDNIDYMEINEAFAGQVLACLSALQDKKYCEQELELDKPIGKWDISKLNLDGGAIALGHPIGASGTRMVWHTLQVLKRQQQKLGIASLCIGGGMGGAILIENMS